tara:strand:+ start:529 stop:1638 length:1110 start_codon:yes stop_codon:yes gene_type:complete
MTFRRAFIGGAVFAVVIVAAFAAPLPSAAQSLDAAALRDRIDRLERDIRTLNVQIARGGSGAPLVSGSSNATASGDPAVARLGVRISELEGELRGVVGRIEEMSFKLNQMGTQLDKVVADVDYRLRQLEQGGGTGAPPASMSDMPTGVSPAAPGPVSGNVLPNGTQVLGTLTASEAENAGPPTPATAPAAPSEEDALLAQLTGEPLAAPAPSAAPAPGAVDVAQSGQPAAPKGAQTAALPDGTPREQYMHAFSLLRQGKYDMAASALNQFLEKNPDDPLVGNARYWLGETYYVRGAFVEAAETFLEGYESDKRGAKAPDALLKLGMSLASLNNKTEACAVFQKLRGDYPEASAGLKSTLEREWQKNGCT